MRDKGQLDFQGLVDLYHGPLYRFALSLSHSESDACDLVQETFAVWAAKGHQLQDVSKVKTWLFTTMYRRFLESRRHAARFPQVEISAVEDELPAIDPELVNRMDARLLVGLLGRVDPLFRGPVALFYLEDYSYNEIAAVLGVPLGTVKSRLARGLAELKRLVAALPEFRGKENNFL